MLNFSVLRGYNCISRIAKGKMITERDHGTDMIVIMQGTLAVLDDNNKLIKTAECGEILNELGVFGDKASSFRALAMTDCVIICISKGGMHSFISCEPEFSFEIMQYMCKQYCAPPASPADTETAAATVNSAGIHSGTEIIPANFQGGYPTIRYKTDTDLLWKKQFSCPVCHNKFQADSVKTSKLSLVEVQHDMRKIYDNIDPIHYDVVTCPSCYYSSFGYCFDQPVKASKPGISALDHLKNSLDIDFDNLYNDIIFIQYYIAIFCAKHFLNQASMHMAKLFMRLAWLFHDCNHANMEKEALENALKYYSDSYTELNLTPEQDQQVCMMIGEINFKLNNTNEAKQYYFRAKMNKEGIPALRRQAEDRLQELK